MIKAMMLKSVTLVLQLMSSNFRFFIDRATTSRSSVLATVGKMSSCKLLNFCKILPKEFCSQGGSKSLGSCKTSSAKTFHNILSSSIHHQNDCKFQKTNFYVKPFINSFAELFIRTMGGKTNIFPSNQRFTNKELI